MNQKNQLVLFLIASVLVLSGCKAFNLRIAENYYDEFAYSKAIPKYEKVLRKSFNSDAASKLADSYRKNGNSLKAEIWYKRLANSQSINLQDKLNYAEVLMENGKYDAAKTWFNEYLIYNNSDKRVKRLIQACDSIHLYFEDTTVYSVNLLKLNKGVESNFSPGFYQDGIIFLSDRYVQGKPGGKSVWTGRGYLDLYFSKISDGDNWIQPQLLRGNINGQFDEGPFAITPDSNVIYFTRTDYLDKTVEKNQKNVSTLQLYKGVLAGNVWNLQSLLPFNSKEYSVGHPAISPDGKTLFFVSDMPWGYGGTDIYSVIYENDKWSEPVNLGGNVNSEGDEMFPFFSNDSVLYFASDGLVGLGGLDIFMSVLTTDGWSEPENLQYPVNSSKDDFGFIINKANTEGYFSSNRNRNLDMIFGFTKNPPEFSFKLFASDLDSKKPLNSFQVIRTSPKGEEAILGEGKDGNFNMNLDIKSSYNLLIKSRGYYTGSVNVSTIGKRKSEEITDSIRLDKIQLRKADVWPGIKFVKKESDITHETAATLDSLASILMLNPGIEIDIISHTDSRGSYSSNLSLSRARAENVMDYLVKKGIKRSRLSPLGYGEAKLLNNCRDGILCLEEDHQVNNRVEIKVTSLGGN